MGEGGRVASGKKIYKFEIDKWNEKIMEKLPVPVTHVQSSEIGMYLRTTSEGYKTSVVDQK
jgi:hypothetical protein